MPREERWARLGRVGWRRGLLIGGALVLAVIVLSGLVLLILGPERLAQRFAVDALGRLGLAPATLTVTHLGWDGVEIVDLNAGATDPKDAPLQIARAKVSFASGGPLAGLGLVDARGVRVHVRWDGSALKLGEMPLNGATPAPAGTTGAPFLSFPVRLTDTVLTFEGGGARIIATAPADVIAGPSDGRGHFDVTLQPVAANAPFAPHQGTLDMALSKAGQVDARLVLAPTTPGRKGLATKLDLQVSATTDASTLQATALLSEPSLADLGFSLKAARITAARAPGASDIQLGLAADGFAITGVAGDRLTLQGRLVAQKGKLSFFADTCGELKGLAAANIAADVLKLCAAKPERPVVTYASDRRETGFDVALLSTRIAVRSREAGTMATGQSPTVALNGTYRAENWQAHLQAEGGDLSLQGRALRLTDLLLAGDLEGKGGALGEGHLDITNAHIKDWTTVPLFAPLTFVGRGTVSGDHLTLALTASTDDKAEIAKATGLHDLASGTGRLDLALAPQTFAPDGRQPAELLPFLKGVVGVASGKVTGRAAFAWSPAKATSSADLGIKELGFATTLGKLEGVNGNVSLASLVPPRTAKPQEIRVRMMDLGLPLPDGRLTFMINPDRTLQVRKAEWKFLDGSIGLSSGLFGTGDTQDVTFAVSRIDLEKLLKLIDIKGLSGTGRVSGELPIRLTRSAQTVTGGHLAADAPGTLVYKSDMAASAGGADGQGKVLFDALNDFRYDELSATIEGNISGDLSLGIHLKGRNPELYNGYPVELNVSTAGPFMAMVRKGLYAYRESGATGAR